ncbi:MAG TPA: VOC family protein [Acidimicrobiia bacterium]|jgi:catechol 2,3-dioxygenase-like lactoylglutathione lyase family enzyme
MNWTLEVVVVPVADIDRAKAFYADQLGFNVDFDTHGSAGVRFVQLTPPGSGCSIVIRHPNEGMEPGSLKGIQLVVNDLLAAHRQLEERGVANGGVQVFAEQGPRPYQEGDELNNVGFVFLSDPDGNEWAVQEISSRP